MPAPAVLQDEDLHWLALRLVPGLGPKKAVPLVDKFRSPQAVFRASRSELQALGLSGSVAQSISSGCTFEDAAAQHRTMHERGVSLISFQNPLYPEPLRQLYDPPLVLLARGRTELLETVKLGVVGTRRPTTYGATAAERLSADLAVAGLTIVSGMARGIDTAAHKAALRVDGATIAVFGCGIDVIYPAENRSLAEQIAAKGLILSEYPMGTPGHPQNFPVRNRIISGISAGVLVVEGAQYSGSAITARLAMEQGREVFAVPGNITSKMSWGANLLIKQGATLVQSAEDVLNELSPEDRRSIFGQRGLPFAPAQGADPTATLQNSLGPSAPLAGQILQLLSPDQPTQIDEIIEKMPNCSSSELIAVLFEIELLGLVRQLPGKNFVKVW
ncbi:MAG: DNA-protecting protein DprA [Acidimicrobiia bacterium]|nr:DNA-protecting protein DprA [Acidimicrobiia bacterium]